MLRLLAVAMVLSACKGKVVREDLRAAKETGSIPSCDEEATTLAKLLRASPHEPVMFQAQRGLNLVERPDLAITKIEPAPVVIMTKLETTFQGHLVDVAELAERLESTRARLASATPPAKQLYFQIDREVPWSRIVPIVEVAERAGFDEPAFVFEAPAQLEPPPRSAIDDKLDGLLANDASNRAVELSRHVADVVKDCPAMQRAFGEVGSSESGNKADQLIEAVAPALIECKCAIDIPSLRSVLWRLLVVAPVIRIVAFDATREQTLALPGSTTWAEASKRFTSTQRGMRFVVGK